ncbi:helix-turn-helix transcriptional regulator [Streptomyces collinus]|uniref:helix-turn-helix transcriptional regulator n=1 Tax=Streptomyces collinus TaxID=42684 RepID=UPI00344AC6B2
MSASEGPVGCHGDLVDLLKRLRDAAGMPPLRTIGKKAGVSYGYLSGIFNGRKLPSPDTAQAIARALTTDVAAQRKAYEYAERAAADRPANRTPGRGDRAVLVQEESLPLEDYLADVCRHAEVSRPYVAQSVVSWQDGRPADRSTARSASAAVFTAGPLVVLLGDPGGGKTELLRRYELDVCRRWEAGVRSGALPVRIPAPSFSNEHLAQRLFAHPPAPGAHWLVLLDSLDEITNARARRNVLRDAVRWAAERPETHRLVIATRHLSEQEQGDLEEAAPVCFELLRFEAGDVRKLAAARLGPDRVDGLMAAIDEAGLADLVELPMIGALVCQLYKDDPDRPLGNTRGAVYDDFITRLMTPTPSTGTRPEHHAGTRGDIGEPAWIDPAVADRVVALSTMSPADLRTLLTQVAHRRRESSPARSVTDILLHEPLTELPGGVPVKWWREQLVACLRRSGVLQQRGDDLEFAHRTYEEFLAACAVCDVREHGVAELRRVLGAHRRRHWPLRPVPGYHPGGGWGRRLWSTAVADGENMSYLGFLIDRLTDAAAADLDKLPSSAGISGCTFLAAQKRLGTYLPASVQARAVEKLKRHIKIGKQARFGASIDIRAVNEMDPGSMPMAETFAALAIDDSRVDSADALLAFAESRAEGLAALRELAHSPRLTSLQGRVAAATAMVRADDESGLDLIVDLASHPGQDDDDRLGIVWQLIRLHRPRGLALLDSWIDARTGGDLWFKAALMVVETDEAYGIARMKAIADDLACPARTRINAAYVTALCRDPRGAEDLLRFARDPDVEERLRVMTVHLLAELGHPSARTVCDELAQEPNLSSRGRKSLRRLPLAQSS